jgi:hypothetical protein
MKLTTSILAMAITMTAALATQAVAQNADAIDNARSTAKALQQKQAIDPNAAADAAALPPAAKPAPGAPAPAVKPAVIPGSKPSGAAPTKTGPAMKSAAKAISASGSNNQLERVNVVEGSDSVRIEMISSRSVTPKASKLDAPARVLVELPETIDASPQNHISFGSAGVKGVRIGTDGKNPPTTSVVVDLDKACTYELTPGDGGKMVLTLHTDVTANSSPAPATKTAAKSTPPASAKTSSVARAPKIPAPKSAATKTVAANKAPAKAAVPAAKEHSKSASESAEPATGAALASPKLEEKKQEDKKWAMNGKRDPFFSPVVQQNGSGCTTGKKCLEIGNINLRGVVKSDNGFIAVVTNNLNKAYFLRENDPVFNGYVVRITGDSVVFQETMQDKLGKPFTREVVKRIFTPAV